jgi:hypothetical protein
MLSLDRVQSPRGALVIFLRNSLWSVRRHNFQTRNVSPDNLLTSGSTSLTLFEASTKPDEGPVGYGLKGNLAASGENMLFLIDLQNLGLNPEEVINFRR